MLDWLQMFQYFSGVGTNDVAAHTFLHINCRAWLILPWNIFRSRWMMFIAGILRLWLNFWDGQLWTRTLTTRWTSWRTGKTSLKTWFSIMSSVGMMRFRIFWSVPSIDTQETHISSVGKVRISPILFDQNPFKEQPITISDFFLLLFGNFQCNFRVSSISCRTQEMSMTVNPKSVKRRSFWIFWYCLDFLPGFSSKNAFCFRKALI